MIYRLIVLNGPCKGQRITLQPSPMTIGRDPACPISLPDEEMATRHAQLEHRGSELFIHDLGSMNKILLNKREVQDCRLKHGDIIELGRSQLLVQAVVQAEVQSATDKSSSRSDLRRRHALAAAAALLLLAGGTYALLHSGDEPEPMTLNAGPPPAPAAEPVPVAEMDPAPVARAPAIPLDDELRRIREDLSSIQQNIQLLNATAEQTSATTPARDRARESLTPEPASGVDEIASVMKAIREAMDAGEYEQAGLMLEHLHIEHPDHLPAYELRAQFHEQQGEPAKAREQWTAVLQRTAESELYRKAVSERIRLGRAESQNLPGPHEAVRIQTLEQVRFRASSDYDEMRTVKIQLSYNRQLGPIDPKGVRLVVYFFEQDLDTQRINLSQVQPYAEANLADLQHDAQESFSYPVSYVVPKGYYSRDHNTSRQRYFGFIARLHYFDRLIDEQARPPKLLEPAILEAAGLALHTARHDTLEDAPPPSPN